MSVEAHPRYKEHWIIIHYPWGRGKNPATGKPERRRERIIYGPCSFEQAKRYEQELVRRTKKVTVSLNPTIAEVFVSFCDHYRLHVSPATYRDFTSAWDKWLIKSFGNLRFTQITPEAINRFKAEAIQTAKPKTVNKLLSYLSAICTWAARPEINHASQTPKITLFPAKMIQPPPLMVPTPDEVQALIEAMPDDNRGALATVMYYAGLRLGDANKITGNQVNLEAGYLIVVGKGQKQRVIPITDELRAVIAPRITITVTLPSGKQETRYNTGYLWPNPKTGKPYADIQKLIDSTCKRLGITKRITHHTLRHSFCTHMLKAGASLRSIQILAGHSSSQVTERYTHLLTDFLGDEMRRIGRPKQNAPQNAPRKNRKGATAEP